MKVDQHLPFLMRITFVRVAINGEWQAPTRFIRNKTTPFEETFTPDTNYNTRLYNDPTYATDIPDSVRCGRDNMAYAADTETLTVRAGDTIQFAHTRFEPYAWTDAMWYNCTDRRGSCNPTRADGIMDINHEGPVIVHLSKVPEGLDVTGYDGSGEWVKIWTLGAEWWANQTNPLHWLAYNNLGLPAPFVFKVPAQTPAGQYLLRIDEINTGLEEHNDGFNSTAPAQIYPSCAQIQVESDYSGELPAGINIPEDLSHTSPGMAVTLSMYSDESIDDDYSYPGGPLWDGIELVQDKPVAVNVSETA
ncbi:putative Glycoside hydrolase [Seiridium cardinale]|uniref:lytic cellulose monooxygenase (C4-dehydrogenating) n=1 Tax=Seiridium cardinale TaxID=138064 RepID=A0ABR2XD32_9PEZI